jgi:hypothetical protein
MTREEIEAFFEGVIVNGCTRDVVFPELSEEGYIEVELVAPPQIPLETVFLSFPEEKSK